MKKFLAVLLLGCAGSLAANPQFRMAMNAAVDFAGRPSFADLETSLDDPANMFYGFQWEVITGGSVGFGMHALVRFIDAPRSDTLRDLDDWWIDWNGDLFLSFHPLGGGSPVDPFASLGYGSAGRALLTSGISGYWYQDDADLWLYEWYEQPYDDLTNLSLYPYICIGLALDLDAFLIEARAIYRPVAHRIPGTQITNYPLKNIQLAFASGVAIGGRRGRRR